MRPTPAQEAETVNRYVKAVEAELQHLADEKYFASDPMFLGPQKRPS